MIFGESEHHHANVVHPNVRRVKYWKQNNKYKLVGTVLHFEIIFETLSKTKLIFFGGACS